MGQWNIEDLTFVPEMVSNAYRSKEISAEIANHIQTFCDPNGLNTANPSGDKF